jgi:ATP-binding cassette subfamily B protein/subfamily B ATP-binding cassette protein MsbA
MYGDHQEEQDIGKVFDFNIIKRLFGIMKPYLKYLIIASVFLVIAAGVEVLYPYIVKIAIDDYIIKNGRKVYVTGTEEDIVEITENTFFITQIQLEEMDITLLRNWEKENKLSSERYYYFHKDQVDDRILSMVADRSELFEEYDNLVLIEYSNLKLLKTSDAILLRSKDISGILRIVLIFLGIIFFGAIANYVQIYLSQYAGQLFMHAIRSKVFAKLQSLHLAFFDRNPVGRLVTRATNDVEAINEAFTQVFARLTKDVLFLIGIIVMMMMINMRLALVSFIVIPILLVVTFYFRVRARSIYRLVRAKLAKLNARFQENLSGIRVIRIFTKEKDNLTSFDGVNKEYLTANLKHVILMSFFRPLIEIISSIGIGLVLYYGGGQVITGKVSLGVLVAFITYVEMFFRPIRELTESYTLLQSAMASSERIFLLLDENIGVVASQKARVIKQIQGAIEFKHVWFKYDKDWVLKNVSFKIRPGEHIAFVGPTGSGKTSIISLISRLYDIQKGTILIDGIDVKDIRLPVLRSQIGVVPQDIFLFAGDIKSNIRLNFSLSDEKVKEIAAFINADKFIDRFPKKYDEGVAERGVTFSTGERQLLSFARALASEPRILVLDEATANIDAETEMLIKDGLNKLIQGKTAIIIAHRLSTIKDANRIYVVQGGEIVELGTHDALINKKGVYYKLYQLQSLQSRSVPEM